MVQGIYHTGIFAFGVGTFVYLYHKHHHGHLLHAEEMQGKTYSPERNKAAVPKELAKEGPLVLKLKQVQVMFRHGARTPLHLTPKQTEANYDHQLLIREHQASVFPFEKIDVCTGKQVGWSDYEVLPLKIPLKSGVPSGALTAYGKDQMYVLGRTLQTCYKDTLNLATYDPSKVFVMSSNIRRTVESARCTLAGFFGKEQLKAFAEFCFPVKIFVTGNYFNIMIPDTEHCGVLKKVNHKNMFDSDYLPGFKENRQAIEDEINKEREEKLDCVKEIQARINLQCHCLKFVGSNNEKTLEWNEHHQPYLRDPVMHPLVEERATAIAKVDQLWSDAMVRNSYLSQIITDNDMRALIYLRRLEVERFDGMFQPGYRFHFYFDPNPYFFNEHLCKEIYTISPHCGKPSRSVPILWKTCWNLLTDIDESGDNLCQPAIEEKNDIKSDKRANYPKKVSFFHWYTQPTCEKNDFIGKAIRDEVWTDPIKSLEGNRKHLNKWDKNFNFVGARDDLQCRLAHGLALPKVLKKFEKVIETNAAAMLYYSMCGQTSDERSVIPRLSAGPLLTYMVNRMDDMVEEKECAPKLFLYSSHDSTMTGMLETLGLWKNKWPPFAADFRFELYRDVKSSEHYVRVLYCGEVQRTRNQQADYIHWRDFKESISKFIIQENEYKDICSSNMFKQIAKDCNHHSISK